MTLSLAIYGCGAVGREVVRLIQESDLPSQDFRIESICVKNTYKHTDVENENFTTDIEWLSKSQGHNVVIDMLPGIEPSFSLITRALADGKKVITCNKELVGQKAEELVKLAGTEHEKIYLNSIPASAEPCEYDKVHLTNKNLLDYDMHDLLAFREADGLVTAQYIFKDIVEIFDDANARCTADDN